MADVLPPAPPQTAAIKDENAHWKRGTALPAESAMGRGFLVASAFLSASSQLQKARPPRPTTRRTVGLRRRSTARQRAFEPPQQLPGSRVPDAAAGPGSNWPLQSPQPPVWESTGELGYHDVASMAWHRHAVRKARRADFHTANHPTAVTFESPGARRTARHN